MLTNFVVHYVVPITAFMGCFTFTLLRDPLLAALSAVLLLIWWIYV